MLPSIISGNFNYLILGKERSIARKIMINRLFCRVNDFCGVTCSEADFEIYKQTRIFFKFIMYIRHTHNRSDYFYNYVLLDCIWHDIFDTIQSTHYETSTLHFIKYNNKTIINHRIRIYNSNYVVYDGLQSGNVLDFMLGMVLDDNLRVISDSIDDYDNILIIKILLLNCINEYTCCDVINTIFMKFIELIL